jgi:tetratricopeptide (TPR) repeat protein
MSVPSRETNEKQNRQQGKGDAMNAPQSADEPLSGAESTATGAAEGGGFKFSKRWAVSLLAILLVTAAIVSGKSWLDDRPLVEVRQRLENGDPERALKLLRYFLNDHPNHLVAKGLMGRALVAAGEVDDAISLFAEYPPTDELETYALAKAQLQKRHWSLALRLLNRTLQMKPDFILAIEDRIACEAKLGLGNLALKDAESLTKTIDWEPTGYNWLAFVHETMGHDQEAIEAYTRVLEYSPEAKGLPFTAEIFLTRFAELLYKTGDYDRAFENAEKSLTHKDSELAYVLQGKILVQREDFDAAKIVFRKALDLDPRNHEARVGLARMALARGDGETAKNLLAPIAEKNNNLETAEAILDTLKLLNNERGIRDLTVAIAELKEEKLVQDRVRKILLAEPESFWGQAVLVHQFASEGNYTQALDLLIPLVNVRGDEPFIQDLARAIQQQSRVLPSLDRIPFDEIESINQDESLRGSG